MHYDINNALDVSSSELVLKPEERSVQIQDGCIGELFGGELFSPSVLVMDLHGNIVTSSVKKYIKDMSYSFGLTLLLNIVDFVTDLLFAQSM